MQPYYDMGMIFYPAEMLEIGRPYTFFKENGQATRGIFRGIEGGMVKMQKFGAGTDLYDARTSKFSIPYIHRDLPPVPNNLPTIEIPRVTNESPTENALLNGTEIENGNIMANFHGERELGRYYLKSTLNQLNPRINPRNRARLIHPNNVTYYRAQLVGGKKRKTKKGRKSKKTRRQGRK